MHRVKMTSTTTIRKRPAKVRAVEDCAVKVQDVLGTGVSQSELKAFVECRTKRRLVLAGWAPVKAKDFLDFGTIGHNYLRGIDEAIKQELKRNAKWLDLRDVVLSTFEAMVEERGKSLKRTSEMQEHEQQSATLEVLLTAYYQHYHAQGDVLAFDVTGLEKALPMLEFEGTFLQGTVDVEYRKENGLAIADHKFKGQINEGMLMQTLETDFQLFFYAFCKQRETGAYPYEALYDVIRRPGIKLGKGDSLIAYKKKLEAHIKHDPSHYFKRFSVQFLPRDFVQFERDLRILVREYVAWLEAGMPYRLYGNPCENKYGLCEFYSLCHHDNQPLYKKGTAGGYRPIQSQTTKQKGR